MRHPDTVAAAALKAAHAQHITLPGQDTAASITADLAHQVLALDDRLKQLDRQIRDAFHTHPQAALIESMPGMGPILGAEFLVAAGDLKAYADVGHLASAAGLVPVAKDSGRRTGNLHRTKRYSRHLRRVFYLSAQTSIIRDGPNRTYYLKKRAEGHKHIPAVIALARRRVDVVWAPLRDNRPFSTEPPKNTDSNSHGGLTRARSPDHLRCAPELTSLCAQPTEQVIHASTPSSAHAVPSLRGSKRPRPDRVRAHHHRRARTLSHRAQHIRVGAHLPHLRRLPPRVGMGRRDQHSKGLTRSLRLHRPGHSGVPVRAPTVRYG